MNEDKPVQGQPTAPAEPALTTPAPVGAAPVPAQGSGLATAMGANKGSNKKKWLIAIIVAVLLAAAGIGYAVYAYVMNSPEALLGQAAENLSKREATAGKLAFTSGKGDAATTYNGDFAVRADKANQENGEVIIGVGESDTRVSLTVRLFDGSLFFRFGSLENTERLLNRFSPDASEAYFQGGEMKTALQRVNDKWFVMTKEELEAAAQSSGQDNLKESLTPADIKKIQQAYRKHQFFAIDKVHDDEKIEGENSLHVTLKMDKQKLEAFLKELQAADIKAIEITDEDIAKAGKSVDDFNKEASLEVWVARSSKEFKQFKLSSKEENSADAGTMTITMLTNLPKFDALEKPQDAKPAQEFLTTLLGPSAAGIAPAETDEDTYYSQEFEAELNQ